MDDNSKIPELDEERGRKVDASMQLVARQLNVDWQLFNGYIETGKYAHASKVLLSMANPVEMLDLLREATAYAFYRSGAFDTSDTRKNFQDQVDAEIAQAREDRSKPILRDAFQLLAEKMGVDL